MRQLRALFLVWAECSTADNVTYVPARWAVRVDRTIPLFV